MENTEPQGIKDLREAKADYLASLSKLREADAEKVKAEAAVEQAKAAIKQAEAAYKQAEVEAQQIKNDLLAAATEAAKEVLTIKLDSIKAAAEKAAVVAEQELAQAQWDLEVALRRIAAASFSLIPAEDSVIRAAADSLYNAQSNYNEELKNLTTLKKALWSKEYDHAAGYDTITDSYTTTALAENYQDSVNKYKGIIQTKTGDIADFEKAKESAEATAKVLGSFADSIKSLKADSLATLTAKSLYDATVLVEANKKYKELVEAFEEDSIPEAPTYLFAEINSDGDTVAKSYPLSGTGDDLDVIFAEYVNNLIKLNGKTAAGHYIFVDDDTLAINVGGKNSAGNYVGKDDLDTASQILGTIVEALNRHMVVVDDSLKAKKLDTLQKAAAKADTAYWKARKALAAGFEDWDVAKDSLDKLKDAFDAKKHVFDSTKTAHKNDTATLLTSAKGLAASYKDSVNAFLNQAWLYERINPANLVTKDTTDLIAAINALGNAKKKYVGVQDSIGTGATKVFFSDLKKEDFDIVKIKNALGVTGNIYTDTANVGKIRSLIYQKNSALAFTVTLNPPTIPDTTTWLKGLGNTAAADFKAGVTAVANAANDTVAPFTAYTTYQSAAKKDYIDDVYKPFFGITTAIAPSDTAKDLEKVDFTWDDETFSFKKEDCIVKFVRTGTTPSTDSIIPTNTLKIVLDGVDGQGYTDLINPNFVNESKIFKGDTWTLFAQAINANQLAKEAEKFAYLKDQLDNITAQYKAITGDLKAYNDQYAADEKAYKAGLKALTGKESVNAIVRGLSANNVNVDKGKWDLAGKQLEFANEVAAEYPALVKATTTGNAEIHARIEEIQVYVDTLNSVAVQWAKFEDSNKFGSVTNNESIINTIDGLINACKDDIADAEKYVDIFEKAVAMAEQGYDKYTIDVTNFKQQIALSETKLAHLEALLKIYKDQYNKVIAEYGVKDTE